MTRKIGVQFDESGEFVGDFLEGMTLPEGHTVIPVEDIQGKYTYVPKLVDGEVVEKLTQDEIDAIRNNPSPKSDLEQLRQQYVDLSFELMIKGVV